MALKPKVKDWAAPTKSIVAHDPPPVAARICSTLATLAAYGFTRFHIKGAGALIVMRWALVTPTPSLGKKTPGGRSAQLPSA